MAHSLKLVSVFSNFKNILIFQLILIKRIEINSLKNT